MATNAASIAPVSSSQGKENNLKAENEKLKKENAALKKENSDLKQELSELRKRKAPPAAAAAQAPTKKLKTPAQRKKLFEKWAKAVMRQSSKEKVHNPWSAESFTAQVQETTPWGVADFEAIFAGRGVKIQPTPENKPTSQITILRFGDHDDIQALFGETEIPKVGYEVQVWRKRNFCKSYKQGNAPAHLESLNVEYNKSKQTLKLLFGLEMDGY